MEKNETRYNIRLSSKSDRNPITKYDETLVRAGFTFEKRKTERGSFYELNDASELDKAIWSEWASKYHLECHVVDMKFTRSDDYRRDYFAHNKPSTPAKYRCVYCGRKLQYKDITVDHLYPVNGLMYRQSTRDAAKMFGIDGANDTKNLVAACRRCNSKKGTKTGIWVLRGVIGKHEGFWKVRNAIVLAAVLFGLYYFYMNGIINLPTPEPFSISLPFFG